MITVQTLEVGGIVPALMSVKLPFSKQTTIDEVLLDYGKKTNEEIEYDADLTPEMKAKYFSIGFVFSLCPQYSTAILFFSLSVPYV